VIAVDANGADQGPAAVAQGVARSGLPVLLFGPAAEISDVAGPHAEIVDAPETIKAGEEAVAAVRSKRDASIVQAAAAVGEGRADALVSAGSTGPTLAAATLAVKRIKGVYRPALAVLMPIPGGPLLLLDAGANVEVRPEHLVQFAHMGAAFMEVVMGIERPRVALLSNGEEPTKGVENVVAAHAALRERPGELNFVGNVEGFAIGKGVCDVLVADGFAGNVALKVMEGTSDVLLRSVRDAAMSSLRSKLGGLLLKPALGGLRAQIDPEAHGGAVLLGLRHLGVVPHGSFGARGFASAIEVAARGVREDVLGRTHERLAEAGALRSVPEPSAAAATLPDQP
jgi:glycerol-3-phosphate acyltransferase PlsX